MGGTETDGTRADVELDGGFSDAPVGSEVGCGVAEERNVRRELARFDAEIRENIGNGELGEFGRDGAAAGRRIDLAVEGCRPSAAIARTGDVGGQVVRARVDRESNVGAGEAPLLEPFGVPYGDRAID